MLCAERGYDDILAIILDLIEWDPYQELGGDLDVQNVQGSTALSIAVAHNEKSCVELLLKKGADMKVCKPWNDILL